MGYQKYGSIDYRLGRHPLKVERRVRFPLELPTRFSSMVERRFVEPDTVVRFHHSGPIRSARHPDVLPLLLLCRCKGKS